MKKEKSSFGSAANAGDLDLSEDAARLLKATQAILKKTGTSEQELFGTSRNRQASHARSLLIWIAVKYLDWTNQRAAFFFNRRNHGTALAAVKRVDALIADEGKDGKTKAMISESLEPEKR